MVRAVFDSVASRYDVMNDLMSLGIHRAWKRIFINDLAPRPQHTLLDLAGGTGDISFGWLRAGGGKALLSDINAAMLSVGRDRALNLGFAADVSLLALSTFDTDILLVRQQDLAGALAALALRGHDLLDSRR